MLLGSAMNDDGIDLLTEKVIACAIEVHKQMGPGLNEGVYSESVPLELTLAGIPYETAVPIPLDYKGQRLRKHFVIDLIVDSRLVVELKAVDALHPAHQAQVIIFADHQPACWPADEFQSANASCRLAASGSPKALHKETWRKNNPLLIS
jgi:GxxExxY protein